MQQDYAVELFVNARLDDYYINRYISDETAFHDVLMKENFALILSDDVIKIAFHSVLQ